MSRAPGPAQAAQRRRDVLTPEGLPLRFTLAAVADRAGAFVLDCVLIAVLGLLMTLPVIVLAVLGAPGLAGAFFLLALFVVRCFYFTLFEALRQGATPGKRALGLRVIAAGGGPLSGEAVFARNLMREVEFFLPLVALLAPAAALPDLPAWARPAALLWLLVVALLPLFNRDRLRAGDLVAGTLVVRAPQATLLRDLSAPSAPAPASAAQPASPYAFAPEQLDIYGIRELHVLEELLRQRVHGDDEALAAVARTIQAKIGWRGARRPADAGAFLRAFYAAQRERLEHQLQRGERRERKR